MSSMTDPDALQPFIRTCQIIVGALVMGVLVFLVITLFLTQVVMNPAPAPGEVAGVPAMPAPGGSSLPVITLVAVAMGVMNLALSFVVPKLTVTQGRRKIAQEKPDSVAKTDLNPSGPKQLYPAGYTGKLAQLYQTQLIIGSALLEAAAFFATVAYLVERSPIALLTALVLLGVLITRFPSSNQVNNWLDRQLELLQDERQSAV